MADANPTPVWLAVLQLVVSWQAVVLAAFLTLRASLISLLKEKLFKFKAGPFEVDLIKPGQEQSARVEEDKARDKSILEKATYFFREDTVTRFQEYVKTESGYANLPTDREKYETLLKYSTTLYIIKTFETLYNTIWGSQLQLIQNLNSVGVADNGILSHYYDYAKTQYPDAYDKYPIEDWTKFLIEYQLMRRVDSEHVEITTVGIDFLKFLVDTRKNLLKSY